MTLEDFVIRSSYTGIHFNGSGATAGKVTNFEILDYESVGLYASTLNHLFVDNFTINAGSDTRGVLGGIRLAHKVEEFICLNGDILSGKYSLTMEAASNTLGNRPAYNSFTNILFDSAVNPAQIYKCVETDFVSCWFSGGRFGVGAAGATVSNSRSIRFTNTRFFNCGGSGVIVDSTASDVVFVNCKAESNSVTAGDGSAHGFQFANNTKEFKLIGCTASNGLHIGKQGYGVFIGSGCDNFTVKDNNLLGNFTGAMLDGSASTAVKFIAGNVGYTTQSKGTATIPLGASSVVVNHGLSVTPQLSDIQISLASSPNGGGSFFVTSPNATTFTVNSATAVTANTIVSWSARTSGA